MIFFCSFKIRDARGEPVYLLNDWLTEMHLKKIKCFSFYFIFTPNLLSINDVACLKQPATKMIEVSIKKLTRQLTGIFAVTNRCYVLVIGTIVLSYERFNWNLWVMALLS